MQTGEADERSSIPVYWVLSSSAATIISW
jgi:hypothetical protein